MTEEKSNRGGLRNPPGGRPKGTKEKRPPFATALEYAMAVINDNNVSARRRDLMATQVLRYAQHQTIGQETGKKAERKEAAMKAGDKFNVPMAPALDRSTVQ